MTDIYSLLLLQEAQLRVINREPFSIDDYRRVIRAIRGDRENAARASAAATRARTKAQKTLNAPSLSVSDLFPGMSATQEIKDDGSDALP